jgi:hypothetical protein
MPALPPPRFAWRAVLIGWLLATVFSGVPSTVWALATGGDPWEATRAAGRMLLPQAQALPVLFAAAAVVHGSLSTFWALVCAYALPTRHTAPWALALITAVALCNLLVVAPRAFPDVAALAFWPQMADHWAWGALMALGLAWGSRVSPQPPAPAAPQATPR